MMDGEILLIRHGATFASEQRRYCGWSDLPLSAKGRAEVLRLKEALGGIDSYRFYSSDLVRCTETLSLLCQEGESVQALRECSFGLFENLTAEEAMRIYPREWEEWCESGRAADGESPEEFNTRLLSFFESIPKELERVALITHGGVIRLLLSNLLTGDCSAQWRFHIETAGFCRLQCHKGYYYLTELSKGGGGKL